MIFKLMSKEKFSFEGEIDFLELSINFLSIEIQSLYILFYLW